MTTGSSWGTYVESMHRRNLTHSCWPQFFQAMCKRREEEEAARLRALEGLTAEERAARLQAEEDARAHEESQMAHFQRLNKKLRGGGRAAVAVRGGRGRGARGGASRGSLK